MWFGAECFNLPPPFFFTSFCRQKTNKQKQKVATLRSRDFMLKKINYMEPKNVNKQFGFAKKYCPAGGQQPTVGVRKLFRPRSHPGIHSQVFLFLLEVVAESRRRVSEDTTHWVMEEPVSMATEQGVILTVKQETQEMWKILCNSGFRCQKEKWLIITDDYHLTFTTIEASGKSRNWKMQSQQRKDELRSRDGCTPTRWVWMTTRRYYSAFEAREKRLCATLEALNRADASCPWPVCRCLQTQTGGLRPLIKLVNADSFKRSSPSFCFILTRCCKTIICPTVIGFRCFCLVRARVRVSASST